MLYTATFCSPLGMLTLTCTAQALTGAGFAPPPKSAPHLLYAPDYPLLRQACEYLAQYFRGSIPALTFKLQPEVTPFRQAVFTEVQKIPYGATQSYQELSEKLQAAGHKACAQAVGGALSHNPLLVFIPCHRVISTKGKLLGYAGGTERQRRLLELEGQGITADYP